MTAEHKIRVLCVEDDADIRFVMELALEQSGTFDIRFAESAQQAEQMMTDFEPQLLLLDQMLPEMTGLEFLQSVRRKRADMNAILISARYTSHDAEQWQQPGVLGLISKPFDPLQLADKVLNFWHGAVDR